MTCVLVVADPERIAELVAALSEPLPQGRTPEVLVSSGGDDTIDLFMARKPEVVVVTASLTTGDSKSLIEALRGEVPAGEVAVVVIGDENGPIRTALDAMDLEPDRFVARPMSSKALRFAVANGLDAVAGQRGVVEARSGGGESGGARAPSGPTAMPSPGAAGAGEVGVPRGTSDGPGDTRAALRKRWSTLADSILQGTEDEVEAEPSAPRTKSDSIAAAIGAASAIEPDDPDGSVETSARRDDRHEEHLGPSSEGEALALPPIVIHPRRTPRPPLDENTPAPEWRPGVGATPVGEWGGEPSAPTREPTLILPDEPMTGTPIATPAELSRPRIQTEPPLDRLGPPRGGAPFDPAASARMRAVTEPVADEPRRRAPTNPPIPAVITQPFGSRPGRAVRSDDLEGARGDEVDEDEVTGVSEPFIDPFAESTPSVPLEDLVTSAREPIDSPRVIRPDDAADATTKRQAVLSPREVLGGRSDAADPYGRSRKSAVDTAAMAISRASTEDHWPMLRPPAGGASGAPRGPLLPPPPPVGGAATGERPPLFGATDKSPMVSRTNTVELSAMLSAEDRARYIAEVSASMTAEDLVVAERGPDEQWSEPVPLAELLDRDRDSRRDVQPPPIDELGLDDFDDLELGQEHDADLSDLAPPRSRTNVPSDVVAPLRQKTPPSTFASLRPPARDSDPPDLGEIGDRPEARPGGRDFARQLRAKMMQMSQRLFQGAGERQQAEDLAPRHDHHTEIDLSALGEEVALGGGVTEIESRAMARIAVEPASVTSPGSWDTNVRDRGLADQGEIVRGVSDAPPLLAKMFAHSSTGRVSFRKDDVEKIVFFDQGRPVFASSNEPGDRMGQLLVREGKITASQYERCQTHVAESGRRMGEILVDFGYLKRRELLPAVRRHVEDILYSLFGWSSGRYHVVLEPTPSAERIRLSRHPASLVLEGIRRKLDRSTLERMVGPSSTVIEVPDRDKLGGVVNLADLSAEERGSLAAFDGQADLAQVARTVGIDVADVLPLAWGLVVLGLASARRMDTEVPEESTALVGETDLVIDRERVRGRWQLVTEADYFALLGVRRDATAFEIRRAYQAARRDFAADCFPQDLRRELAQELEDIAQVLDEAFRVLRDDRLRLTYLSNLVE